MALLASSHFSFHRRAIQTSMKTVLSSLIFKMKRAEKYLLFHLPLSYGLDGTSPTFLRGLTLSSEWLARRRSPICSLKGFLFLRWKQNIASNNTTTANRMIGTVIAATVPGDVLCAAVVDAVRRNIYKKKPIIALSKVDKNWLKVLRWHGYF